ncbi:uncharacterized protein LOC100881022 [Megachile rotundata]|uniref:uncharacterized protein LOC100881022 n=1 Tax=Megachile rotundata TaxID=143995 RepID=UPI003FD51BA0
METLQWTQIMFTICGNCLRPLTCTPFKRFIYNIYIIVGKILLCTLVIAQVLDIVLNVENQDEFTENFAISSTMIMITFKYIILSVRRVNIADLIEKLNRNLFMPANTEEMEIRIKFNRIIDLTTKAYTIIIAIFATGVFVMTFIVDYKGRKLVGRLWLPYDYTSTTLYVLTSVCEFLATAFGVSVNIACECLYAGLTLHICCQFEILEHRFKTLDGKDICAVNRCASHHHHIYEYAKMINNEFKKIVSCQFFMSMSVLCLNLFRMLIAQNFLDFVEVVMYMVCMFSQIFYYCFHGNLVKAKSIDFSDEIFGSDWPSWNDNSKKVLLMVIRRSKRPIEFTSMHVVTLSLESFMSLLKTSYSAYNLMTKSNNVTKNLKGFREGRRKFLRVHYSFDHTQRVTSLYKQKVLFNIEDRGFSLKRMHKFPLSFTLLTCCGYWRPTKWPTNSFKYWLYNIYSVFMIGFIWFFAFYAMVDSVTSKDLTTMSDKLSVGLSVLRVCVQVPILFIQRNKIISVVHILLEDDCIPRDEGEVIIKRKCDSLARNVTIFCELLNESSAFISTVMRYNHLIRTRTFPRFSWMPFSLDRIELYMVSLLHQTCGLFICANTSVAIETMVAGLLMQARGQFEMFCHRARNVPVALMAIERDDNSGKNLGRKWRKMRRDLVRYHLHIINFVNSINSAFQYIIAIQFLISSSVLCLSVYQMSLLDLFTVDMLFSYSYVGSMFTQVYLYCWFGNEMTLKSTELADAIYGMDWTILPTDVQKDLLIIMIRSMKPVKITCAHILILSVDSFVSIIKISYSTYNLLKTTDGT